jgi:uncharacterized protein (TIGR02722 family)
MNLFRILALAAAFLLASCAGTTVDRISADSTVDLSGKWNDTDSRIVADTIVNQCLGQAWYTNYMQANAGKLPLVRLGEVRNNGREHINVETFMNDITRSLLNSGKVEFVAGGDTREQLHNELDSQNNSGYTNEAEAAAIGNESAPALLLTGALNQIVDQEGGKRVVFYQVDFTLTQVNNGRLLWMGSTKIKKFVEQSGSSI